MKYDRPPFLCLGTTLSVHGARMCYLHHYFVICALAALSEGSLKGSIIIYVVEFYLRICPAFLLTRVVDNFLNIDHSFIRAIVQHFYSHIWSCVGLLSLFLCLYLYLLLSLWPLAFLPISAALSTSLYLSLPHSLQLPLSLSTSIYLSLTLSSCLSLSSLSTSFYLSPFLPPSLSLLSLSSFSTSFYPFLPPSLSPSLSRSLCSCCELVADRDRSRLSIFYTSVTVMLGAEPLGYQCGSDGGNLVSALIVLVSVLCHLWFIKYTNPEAGICPTLSWNSLPYNFLYGLSIAHHPGYFLPLHPPDSYPIVYISLWTSITVGGSASTIFTVVFVSFVELSKYSVFVLLIFSRCLSNTTLHVSRSSSRVIAHSIRSGWIVLYVFS